MGLEGSREGEVIDGKPFEMRLWKKGAKTKTDGYSGEIPAQAFWMCKFWICDHIARDMCEARAHISYATNALLQPCPLQLLMELVTIVV